MRKYFYKPLKMNGTQVRDYKLSKLDNILDTFKGDGKGRYTVTTCDFMPGDGGVYTHIGDLKKWSKFLAGHSQRYGSKLNPYLYARDGKGYSHGLKMGSGKKACGRHTRTHGGSWRGARTQMVHLPNQQIFAYVLCNGAKCGKTVSKATRELLKVYYKYTTPAGRSCE
jgi:CubicO group peptidase (beta-lactamase class C family)